VRGRTIAGDGPVHHGEDGRVQLTLHVQEVDQHFVHVLVSVVTHLAQQPAKGILHRAGHHGMTVRLHGGKVEDLPSWVNRRNLNAFRKDVVQFQERALEPVDAPFHIGQRREREAMAIQHRLPAVVAASLSRGCDDCLVLDGDQPFAKEAIRQHLPDDAVHLPRL